ncbi:MAG TPA: TIGR00159 family protein [Clostridiales bacterium]|nr:TIGR00159 family protein [Clostridiales bacterium]HBR07790.1 TIGR00159 family protein [Clostridiales bacterium]
MTAISEFLNKSVNYLLTIGFSDLLDILIVATLIYHAIGLIRKTNSSRVARGIIMILVALWLSGPGLLNLTMFNMFLRKTVELGLIAIVIIFQPELRRVLERVGSSKITDVFLAETAPLSMDSAITQTVLACSDMSKTRTGALIIFERNNRLNDPMSTGTIIGAETTAELLRNIFYPKAPLHDGAAIIREGRIVAAGCMLPLSHNANLSRDLGMRHRAGIGMSEHSDAVVVIVSEETGSISVAIDGMLKRHLSADTFERILRSELIQEEDIMHKRGLAGLLSLVGSLRVRKNEK